MPDDPNEEQNDPGRLRQMMEEANARAAAAEARAAQLESASVFREAGLDPSKPLHQVVMRGYDGPIEVEAVQKYVADLGVNEQPPPPEHTNPEQEQLERIAAAAQGDGRPAPAPDRRDQIRESLDKIARRGNQDELNRAMIEFSRAGGFKTSEDFGVNADLSPFPTRTEIARES